MKKVIILTLFAGACSSAPKNGGDNHAPTASFAVTGDAVALGTMLFDAAGSSDPDGDTLRYDWSFGDGGRGGVSSLPHLFGAAGAFKVTLTVTDSKGLSATSTKDLTIGAGTQPGNAIAVLVTVKDANGATVVGADIAVEGSPSAAQTDANGQALVSIGTGITQNVRVLKPGYTRQVRTVKLAESLGADATLNVTLTPRAPAQTLADIGQGGDVTGTSGAKLTLPAGSLLDADGKAVTGAIEVSLTPIDNRLAREQFPGGFGARNQRGDDGLMLSYGVVEFALSQGGAALNLAPGATATTELPMYSGTHPNGTPVAAGDVVPLWSLDERTGVWVQEGEGVVVASPSSATGFALRATLGHFSWWNTDAFNEQGKGNANCRVVEVTATQDKIDAVEAGVCTVGANVGGGARRDTAPPTWDAITQTRFRTNTELPLPANVPITFTTFTLNGTWAGTQTITVAPGQTVDLDLVVHQVTPDNLSNDPIDITLPTDRTDILEIKDREEIYRFNAPSTDGVVKVDITGSSTLLQGTFEVRRPNEAPLCTRTLSMTKATCIVDSLANEPLEIGVTATNGAPSEIQLHVEASTVSASPFPLTVNYANPANTDYYDVELDAGDPVLVTITKSASVSGKVSVLDQTTSRSSRAVTAGSSSPGTLRFIAPTTGHYLVVVEHVGGAVGTVTADIFDPTPTLVNVPSLPYFASGFNDTNPKFFKFHATAGQKIGAMAHWTSSTGSSNMDFVIHTPMPNLFNHNVSSFCPSIVPTFTAPETGDYYVEVLEPSGSNWDLAIDVVRDLPIGTSDLGDDAVLDNQSRFYSFTRGADVDFPLSVFNTYMCAFGPDGTKVQNTPGGPPGDLKRFPLPGTYTVIATPAANHAANTWAIGVSPYPTPTMLSGEGVLAFNEPVANMGQMVNVTIAGAPGDFYMPRFVTTGGLYAAARLHDEATPTWDGATLAFVNGTLGGSTWCNDKPVRGTGNSVNVWAYSTNLSYATLFGAVSGAVTHHTPEALTFDGSSDSPMYTLDIPGLCNFRAWTFTLPSATLYRVRAQYLGPTVPTIPVANVRFDDDDTSRGFSVNGSGNIGDDVRFRGEIHLLDAGAHYLTLAGDEGSTMAAGNNLTLELLKIEDATTLTVMPSGSPAPTAGTVSRAGRQVFYRFTNPSSGAFSVSTTGPLTGKVYLYLDSATWYRIPIGAQNTTIGTPFGNTPAGTYIVAIVPDETDTGSFSVGVTQ